MGQQRPLVVRGCFTPWVSQISAVTHCVCMPLRVRVCAAQPASSANAPWKTNSVSVDSISRQRSSSDPPAVHPPLPPLRVTSTSTFFFPFSLSCRRASYNTDGWWGGVGGGPLGCPGLHAAEGSSVAASLRPPSSPAAGCCLSHSPRGSPPPLLHLQALQQRFFLSTVVLGLPLATPCLGYRGVFLWIRICSVFPFSVTCAPGGGAGGGD